MRHGDPVTWTHPPTGEARHGTFVRMAVGHAKILIVRSFDGTEYAVHAENVSELPRDNADGVDSFAARALAVLLRPGSELAKSRLGDWYVCTDGESGADAVGDTPREAVEKLLEHLDDLTAIDDSPDRRRFLEAVAARAVLGGDA